MTINRVGRLWLRHLLKLPMDLRRVMALPVRAFKRAAGAGYLHHTGQAWIAYITGGTLAILDVDREYGVLRDDHFFHVRMTGRTHTAGISLH